MNLRFKTYSLLLATLFFSGLAFSQTDNQKVKAQFALGVNHPSENGFVDGFYAKGTNFPTINLGLQYMFSRKFGGKLDFGYNRFSNESNSPDFKINYTRINAQGVYDASFDMGFLPDRIGVVFHAGPGLSFIKPLGNYPDNKLTYLNAMAGVEVHYDVSPTFSVYADTSYIAGFAKDFDPITEGYGSFNGNLLTFTVGVSVSLSGCRTCD